MANHWCHQVNIGAIRQQAITWTNVDLSSVRSCGIHLRVISQWMSKPLFCITCLKIMILKLLPHLPGASEFMIPYNFCGSDDIIQNGQWNFAKWHHDDIMLWKQCEENLPATSEFQAQRASNAKLCCCHWCYARTNTWSNSGNTGVIWNAN